MNNPDTEPVAKGSNRPAARCSKPSAGVNSSTDKKRNKGTHEMGEAIVAVLKVSRVPMSPRQILEKLPTDIHIDETSRGMIQKCLKVLTKSGEIQKIDAAVQLTLGHPQAKKTVSGYTLAAPTEHNQ